MDNQSNDPLKNTFLFSLLLLLRRPPTTLRSFPLYLPFFIFSLLYWVRSSARLLKLWLENKYLLLCHQTQRKSPPPTFWKIHPIISRHSIYYVCQRQFLSYFFHKKSWVSEVSYLLIKPNKNHFWYPNFSNEKMR